MTAGILGHVVAGYQQWNPLQPFRLLLNDAAFVNWFRSARLEPSKARVIGAHRRRVATRAAGASTRWTSFFPARGGSQKLCLSKDSRRRIMSFAAPSRELGLFSSYDRPGDLPGRRRSSLQVLSDGISTLHDGRAARHHMERGVSGMG